MRGRKRKRPTHCTGSASAVPRPALPSAITDVSLWRCFAALQAGPRPASPNAECSGAEAGLRAQAATAMASESLGALPAPPEWITFPLPLTSPDRCPLARPAWVSGPPRDTQAFQYSAPLPLALTQSGWKGLPGWRERFSQL